MCVALPGIQIPLVICVLYLGTHITSDYVFPYQGNTIPSYKSYPTWETHIHSDICSPTRERNAYC